MRDDIVPEMLVQHVLVSPAPAPDVDPVVVDEILSRVEELLGRTQNSGAVSPTCQSIDQHHSEFFDLPSIQTVPGLVTVTAWYLGRARLGPGVSWAVRGDHQEQDPVTWNIVRG